MRFNGNRSQGKRATHFWRSYRLADDLLKFLAIMRKFSRWGSVSQTGPAWLRKWIKSEILGRSKPVRFIPGTIGNWTSTRWSLPGSEETATRCRRYAFAGI